MQVTGRNGQEVGMPHTLKLTWTLKIGRAFKKGNFIFPTIDFQNELFIWLALSREWGKNFHPQYTKQ